MVMNKRAQFFLLAAVIISVVVISLGITANRATVNREPGNFYDFSYEVKRETGAVLDYEIYTNIEGGSLDTFVNLLAEDIRDKNPEANFLFLYGDNESMELRNYGEEEAFVEGVEGTEGTSVVGSSRGAISTICYGSVGCQSVKEAVGDFDDGAGAANLPNVGDNVSVEVEGNKFFFPVSRHRQIIFIMQKGVGDESFVAVK